MWCRIKMEKGGQRAGQQRAVSPGSKTFKNLMNDVYRTAQNCGQRIGQQCDYVAFLFIYFEFSWNLIQPSASQ